MDINNYNKNHSYLIEENIRNGYANPIRISILGKDFIVPYHYRDKYKTDKEAIKEFEDDLFDFEKIERKKYEKAHKGVRVVKVNPEGRGFVIPFDYEGNDYKKVINNTLNKAETKYNMIINAHRDLFENNFEVAPVQFSSKKAEEYVDLLNERERTVALNEETPDMLKVLEFFDGLGKEAKVFGGKVIRKGEKIANRGAEAFIDFIEKKGNLQDDKKKKTKKVERKNTKKSGYTDIALKIKKKIAQLEFNSAKKFVTKNYKIAILAGALSIGGPMAWNGGKKIVEKIGEGIENIFGKKDEYKLVKNGVYTTFDGTKLEDKYGNLEKINNLRKEITVMMTALEGYKAGAFKDGGGTPTVGIGLTFLYDEQGKVRNVTMDDFLSPKEAVIQKWRYIEAELLPDISTKINRECSNDELKTLIGLGFCVGKTTLKKSKFWEDLKKGKSIESLRRKLTRFRVQEGVIKRAYLLANVLEGNWDTNDLSELPVYRYKDGYLNCAVYTKELDEYLKCDVEIKKGKKSYKPLVERDGCCSFYMSKNEQILNELKTPLNGKDYKFVHELLPEEVEECFEPNYCLSEKQKKLAKVGGENEKNIDFLVAKKNIDNKGR